MMKLQWHESRLKMFAHGLLKHKVWPASVTDEFYAKSGIDIHGPYQTAQAARRACGKIETQENN
jgi:hypothetical protein